MLTYIRNERAALAVAVIVLDVKRTVSVDSTDLSREPFGPFSFVQALDLVAFIETRRAPALARGLKRTNQLRSYKHLFLALKMTNCQS
jgi:hypothetical protein